MPHSGIGQKGKIIAPILGHARKKFTIAQRTGQSKGPCPGLVWFVDPVPAAFTERAGAKAPLLELRGDLQLLPARAR